jgi:thiol-disulfide isomerase/thioredoxin
METNLITGKEGQPLPSFNLLLPDSSTIYHTNQMKGKPTVFFLFGPNCPYCQQQMDEIKTNMIELENIQFVILTGEGFRGMKDFVDQNGLNGYPNVIAGLDTADFFMKYYKLGGYPSTAFYNKEGVLQNMYSGEVKMEKFISIAQKLD